MNRHLLILSSGFCIRPIGQINLLIIGLLQLVHVITTLYFFLVVCYYHFIILMLVIKHSFVHSFVYKIKVNIKMLCVWSFNNNNYQACGFVLVGPWTKWKQKTEEHKKSTSSKESIRAVWCVEFIVVSWWPLSKVTEEFCFWVVFSFYSLVAFPDTHPSVSVDCW